MRDFWLQGCDYLVLLGTAHCVVEPITAIASGELYGPMAFVAGAIVVGSATFCEFYLRVRNDV